MQSTVNHNNQERSIELSVGARNLNGNETHYDLQQINTSSLERVFTSNNYSPIIWENSYRSEENFLYATGFCIDNDEGLTVEQALEKLKAHNWNYALITTRSHAKEAHRFRVFILFNRKVHSLADYKRITGEFVQKYWPTNDPQVRDGARQLFASPAGAEFHCYWDGIDYDVDASLATDHPVRIQNAWTEKLTVTLNDNSQVKACSLTSKAVIYCPFHDESNASAFMDISKKTRNFFICCSACGKTYWMEKPIVPIEQKCERFYSYRTDVFDVGLAGEEFFINKVGQQKFYVWVDASSNPEKQEDYFAYLVREKHIRHLKRIDHIGDMDIDESFFEYDRAEGIFIVHYAPLPTRIQDNAFIEQWLAHSFGKYAPFIKRWLAAYCYTNYDKLPTLVLRGDRGTGKNTFAEAVMAIYPSLAQFWHGEDRNFTPEVQKKLLVADESVARNEKQYRLLKQRSGQKMAVVNQKFVPEYQVKNNMNVIILSNDATPIFVEKHEQPTSEKNNQFFVYSMPKLDPNAIDRDYGFKIEDRLGHYIRTELKVVHESISNNSDYRYSIPTPITDEEKALFNANQTVLEDEAMKFLRKMVEQSDPIIGRFFNVGLFPNEFIDGYTISKGYTRNGVIRALKELDYLAASDPIRKMVNGQRKYCFEMTGKLKMWYRKEKSAGLK
jgi:hypothetical protein